MGKCSNVFFPKVRGDHANYLMIVSCLASLAEPCTGLTPWPLLRVIRGHTMSSAFLPITFDRIEIEQGLVSVRFSRLVASTDMEHKLSGSPRDLMRLWPDVKICHFWVDMHIFRRVWTRETRWLPNYFAGFLVQKLSLKHDGVQIISQVSQFKSYVWKKKLFFKNSILTLLDLSSLTC